MSQTLRLMTMKEFVHFSSISRNAALEQTVAQFSRQRIYLETLRIRRPDVLRTFTAVVDDANTPNLDMDSWVKSSKASLSKTFDQIVVDSSGWMGQGIGAKTLVKPLNDICHHTLHAMMCLDLLAFDAIEKGLVARDISVHKLVTNIVEDVSSFSKEKFGVCPEFTIRGELNLVMFAPFVEFILVEILKNAIKAVIDRHGALDIDDANPIEVHLSDENKLRSKALGSIVIHDYGVGMDDEMSLRCFDAFYSKTAEANKNKEPTYQYSRDFGATFSGTGIGLLKSKVYLDFHGGNIGLKSKQGEGTVFYLNF